MTSQRLIAFGALGVLIYFVYRREIQNAIDGPPSPIGEPGSNVGAPGEPVPDVTTPDDPPVIPWYAGAGSGLAAGCAIVPPWGCIAGSIVGGIIAGVRQFSNVTEEQREKFAQEIGFFNLGKLYDHLRNLPAPFTAEGERLWNIGINIIGRHDYVANEAWMVQVAHLLDATGGVPDGANCHEYTLFGSVRRICR